MIDEPPNHVNVVANSNRLIYDVGHCGEHFGRNCNKIDDRHDIRKCDGKNREVVARRMFNPVSWFRFKNLKANVVASISADDTRPTAVNDMAI